MTREKFLDFEGRLHLVVGRFSMFLEFLGDVKKTLVYKHFNPSQRDLSRPTSTLESLGFRPSTSRLTVETQPDLSGCPGPSTEPSQLTRSRGKGRIVCVFFCKSSPFCEGSREETPL